jgi:hypothetical protein
MHQKKASLFHNEISLTDCGAYPQKYPAFVPKSLRCFLTCDISKTSVQNMQIFWICSLQFHYICTVLMFIYCRYISAVDTTNHQSDKIKLATLHNIFVSLQSVTWATSEYVSNRSYRSWSLSIFYVFPLYIYKLRVSGNKMKFTLIFQCRFTYVPTNIPNFIQICQLGLDIKQIWLLYAHNTKNNL